MRHRIPADAIEFLRSPQHAVIGWISSGNRPLTVATWYDWDDGEVLINMDAGRRRRAALGVGALVSLTVLDAENWYRHLSLYGAISRVAEDDELIDIDRLARRYTGAPYSNRANARVSAWIALTAWHGWIEGAPWPSR